MEFPNRKIERDLLLMLMEKDPTSRTEDQMRDDVAHTFPDMSWGVIFKELCYLRDKKLIEIKRIERGIMPVVVNYSITAKGIDVCSGTKL